MTKKEKTAFISIFANLILTILKFVAFSFTGSIAVLAEAWHSFSDITTSIMVFISVREKPLPLLRKKNQQDNKKELRLEYIISFLIGLLLFSISLALMYKVLKKPPVIIENPLVVGICFIVFAIISYVVFHYETSVGKQENSVGLIADGMHSKADMVNSLLIGFSLILYKMGLNIDIIVAFFIALFILSFSIETIVNTVIAYEKRQQKYSFKYRSISLISLLFDLQMWKDFRDYLKNRFFSKIPLDSIFRKTFKYFLNAVKYTAIILVLVLIFLYVSTCVYSIGPSQEGILERFGKSVNYGQPIQSGIHFKFPWPIDRVTKVNSRTITAINIGNITDKNTFALLWTREHGTETPFISGDNNFFYPYLVVHYKIDDIFKYKYNHIDADTLVDDVSSRIISNVFAKKTFYQIVTTYRRQFETDITRAIQTHLDMVESGIKIVNVNMKDIHPPVFIASSFEGVIAAYQEKEQIINEALGYRNKKIPDARGKAKQITQSAESYIVKKTEQSTGETSRFLMQLEGFQASDGIMRKKMYYDFIKESFSKNKKIIVDPNCGVPDVYMKFDRFSQLYGND